MTLTRPLVSVVAANFNGARFLAAAIRSVLGQTLQDLELIIVDDASMDQSLEVIRRVTAGDPRVRVIVQECNGGPAAARNRGFEHARGRWIAVFDTDDLMADDRLERLVARGEEDGADLVVDNLMVFDERGLAASRPFLPLRKHLMPRWITLADYVAASRMYARAPSFGYLKPLFRAESLGPLRYRETLKIGEDYDLVLRMLLAGAAMRLEPLPLYRYRRHGGSISHVMERDHILAMMAADGSLAREFSRHDQAVRRQQQARTRSLELALIYDRIIGQLKARKPAPAFGLALARPGVWPLLTMPIEARLKRLGAWFMARTGHVVDRRWSERAPDRSLSAF
jgi:succinoglycan biosynthesis protein ExoO